MDTTKKEFDPINVWSSNSNLNKIDTITPHKVIVVFLVREYIKVKTEECEKNGFYPAKFRKQFSMLLLKLIQYPDLTYRDLHACLASPCGGIDSRHLHYFEEYMDNVGTIGVDIMFDLQIFMGRLLTDNVDVNHFGIAGFYIRRILLALNVMSFPDMIDLYKSINTYYERGVRAISMSTPCHRHAPVTDITGDSDSSAIIMADVSSLRGIGATATPDITVQPPDFPIVGKDKNGHSKWSVKQADLFIAQQCDLLECNETKAMRPKELQQRLKEISQDIPHYTQAHNLSYMNNLRVRDFCNALDSFHRAYDRSATRGTTAAGTAAEQSANNAAAVNTNVNNKGLQYSSLNLAILHVQFGHEREALASLRESVMLAQEAGDRICLQLAQSWLCLLDKKYVLLCESSVTNQMENSAVQTDSLGVQFIVNVAAISGKF